MRALGKYKLNSSISLKNRVVMAPMTRRFAERDGCVTDKIAAYYEERAEAGLIVTEGTLIGKDAIGYGNVPGIYSSDQIRSWSKVVDKIHNADGVIFMQLWHCGRVSHPNFHNGNRPISCSETTMKSKLGSTGLDIGTSRAASTSEINELIKQFSMAAKNAIDAGFDGVELHGANGYLIDQFLHTCTNFRTDQYGGTAENMSRFCLDVVTACIDRIGNDRVGLRLSPGGHMAEIETSVKDSVVFTYLFKELSKLNIAYVHMGNFDDSCQYPGLNNQTSTQFTRSQYNGTLVTSGATTSPLLKQDSLLTVSTW